MQRTLPARRGQRPRRRLRASTRPSGRPSVGTTSISAATRRSSRRLHTYCLGCWPAARRHPPSTSALPVAKISGRSVAKSLQTYRIPRSPARSASWQQGPRQRAIFTSPRVASPPWRLICAKCSGPPAALAAALAESGGGTGTIEFHASRARRRSSPVPAARSSFRARKRASPSSGVRRSPRTTSGCPGWRTVGSRIANRKQAGSTRARVFGDRPSPACAAARRTRSYLGRSGSAAEGRVACSPSRERWHVQV
jgi:hypothetical protein